MTTTVTPNMGLVVPTAGSEPGPDWATELNADLTAIDSHNHSSGQGVQITPDGININADLPMNNSNLITARTLRFDPQSATPGDAADIGCLYENGVDLYYIDGAGNDIRITQSGSLAGAAGTITGLPSGTASASFAAGTFTFEQSTNTPAEMSVGPTRIGQAVASGYGVTISAAVGQAADYDLALPAALPASTKILTISSSGNIGDSLYVDNSTLEVSSNSIQVKDDGITTDKIADEAVTYAKLAPINTTLSNSSGSYTTTSTSFVDVTNLAPTITSHSSRSIKATLINNSDTSAGSITATGSYQVRLLRSGSDVIGIYSLLAGTTLSNIEFIDLGPQDGSTEYKLQVKVNSSGTVSVTNLKLWLLEL